MLTCHDVSAIMDAIYLFQIHIILMKSPLNYQEFILTYGHYQSSAQGAMVLSFVTVSTNSLTTIYTLFILVMTHSITCLIVYLEGIHENFI